MGTEFKQSNASCAETLKSSPIECQNDKADVQDQEDGMDPLEGSFEASAACMLLTAAQGS
jgi:hypothetical protein